MPQQPLLWNPANGGLSLGKMPQGAVVSLVMRNATGAGAITVGADSLLPHIEFEPDLLGWGEVDDDRGPMRVRGQVTDAAGDPETVIYKWDPGCAVQLPWSGNLFLRGGTPPAFVQPVQVELHITYCGPKPAADPTLTYVNMGRVPTQLPRGAYAVSSPIAQTYEFTVLGVAYTVALTQSVPFGLGALASGTIQVAAAGTFPAPITTAYLRVG